MDFKVGNETIRLYPIGALSREFTKQGIPRDTQTIRYWIKCGIIPRPIFFLGNYRPKKMFTMDQIMAIVNTAKECKIRQGMAIADTEFSKIVHQKLAEINKKYIK